MESLRTRPRLFCFCHTTAPARLYALSLHDALPIYLPSPVLTAPIGSALLGLVPAAAASVALCLPRVELSKLLSKDRKSTRLNSSHITISYAVFCLKKKNIRTTDNHSNDRYTE